MTLIQHAKAALAQPPWVLFRKAAGLCGRGLRKIYQRRLDRSRPTYHSVPPAPIPELHRYLDRIPKDSLRPLSSVIGELSSLYLEHRFDLLGSGWVQVRHGMECRGVEGFRYEAGDPVEADREGRWLEGRVNVSNLGESRRIWMLVDEGYVPIHWNLDFKSGYRWPESDWYRDVRFGLVPGADIKVPWELARMQHLPQLAWAHALATDAEGGFRPPARYSREFRNQILDFIASNPPRFGVNWACPMDVGIRVANWLITYDLFLAYDARFDDAFQTIFNRSVYEHGRHIYENLEWDPQLRGNHYLADLAGLLFASAYLPSTPERDVWLAFAVQEIVGSVGEQFSPDGVNFEASTCYHRLSAEMVLYATALILGLPSEKREALSKYDPRLHRAIPTLHPPPVPQYPMRGSGRRTPFPDWYIGRLEKMAEFTVSVTKPNGRVPQIGDNDSGRFLKIQPDLRRRTVREAKLLYKNLDGYIDMQDGEGYWDEDDLDHRHLVAAMSGLFDRKDFTEFSGHGRMEPEVVRSLAGGNTFPVVRDRGQTSDAQTVQVGTEKEREELLGRLTSFSPSRQKHVDIRFSMGDLREGMRCHAYPAFGLYLFCSGRFYLAVRCGDVGQNGFGGHAHNDQLSIELSIDGEDWIADPGTYLYTASPARRNEYRSVKAHFAPRPDEGEPGDLRLGLFRLGNEAQAKCLYFGEQGFVGMHYGYGYPLFRSVAFLVDGIRVSDFSEGKDFADSRGQGWSRKSDFPVPVPFSDGYGRQRAT